MEEFGGEEAGAATSGRRISGFDAAAGTVSVAKGDSEEVTFDHLKATLPPEATQAEVYDAMARPLVERFVEGYDVDLLSYGQTGAGKTFSMFGPPRSMEAASAALGGGETAEAVLKDEHGFILRSGMDCLRALEEVEKRGGKARLFGSMVELSIMSLTEQSVSDLLKSKRACYVDDNNHLQGAMQVPLRKPEDVVRLAAAVEQRCVRGTKMNDTSSRSHCVASFTLLVVEDGNLRTSRLQFFDMMGSERFKGGNAAHDEKHSTQSTMGGWEGIFANLSLSALASAVDAAAQQRKTGKKRSIDSAMVGFLLTKLLMGSLVGSAMTGMVACLSQAPKNGEETFLSLKYTARMAQLMNAPKVQPSENAEKALARARKHHMAISALVAKGVAGKYQARRAAELTACTWELGVLEDMVG